MSRLLDDDTRRKVSVHELRTLSTQARQPQRLTIEHFLRKVRFAMRTAASRGDVDCRYTLPLIELGIPLYDPAKTARQVAEALKQEDRKLIVSVSANVVYVSWAG